MKLLILNFALVFNLYSQNEIAYSFVDKTITTKASFVDPITVAQIGFAIGGAVIGYVDSREKDRKLKLIIEKLEQFDIKLDEIKSSIENLGYVINYKIDENYRNDLRSKLISQLNQYSQMKKLDKKLANNILDEIKDFSEQIKVLKEEDYIYYYQLLACAMVIQFDLNKKLKKDNENIRAELRSYSYYYQKIKSKLESQIDANKPGEISATDYFGYISRGPKIELQINFSISKKDDGSYTSRINTSWNSWRYLSNAFDFNYNPGQPKDGGVCVNSFDIYLKGNGKRMNHFNQSINATELDLELLKISSCIKNQRLKIVELKSILEQIDKFILESERMIKLLD